VIEMKKDRSSLKSITVQHYAEAAKEIDALTIPSKRGAKVPSKKINKFRNAEHNRKKSKIFFKKNSKKKTVSKNIKNYKTIKNHDYNLPITKKTQSKKQKTEDQVKDQDSKNEFKKFGWKNLGNSQIIFNDELKEKG